MTGKFQKTSMVRITISIALAMMLGLLVFTVKASAAPYWANTYGGSNDDWTRSIQQTADGGYIVAGYTYSYGAGYYDNWLLKLDGNGDIDWQKTYGSYSSLGETPGENAYSVQQTIDEGYIVAGKTTWYAAYGAGLDDYWVLKLDSDGNVGPGYPGTWQKTYGGSSADRAYSIQQTIDEGYIVAGFTASDGAGSNDYWVLKLDSDGNVDWQKTYGGSNIDRAYSIQQTIDEGYIVAGFTTSDGAGSGDYWVLKLDSGGNVDWEKTYGGSSDDVALSIQQTIDEGYIVAGFTASDGAGSNDYWVLKLDSDGNVGPGYPGTWQKTYGGSSDDRAYSIQQTTDEGYIVAGSTSTSFSNDSLVLKLDSSGNVLWQKTYGGKGFLSIQQTADGYITAGYKYSDDSLHDSLVLKLDSDGDIPDCDIVQTNNAGVSDTSISGSDTSRDAQTSFATVDNSTITPQDSSAEKNNACIVVYFDSDGDGIPDTDDNCPNAYNPAQIDCDGDGDGDACDNDTTDSDADGVDDGTGQGHGCDNCPFDFNPVQGDNDNDTIGNICDDDPCYVNVVSNPGALTPTYEELPDTDCDGNPDEDNCPDDPDKTEPGICGCGTPDTDSDSDGTPDCNDNCPDTPNGPDNGTCVREIGSIIMGTGVTCTDNSSCGIGETCDMVQGDINGNGAGDTCECYADFNDNGRIDGGDMFIMVDEANASMRNCDPDNETSPPCCYADVNVNGRIDGGDMFIMVDEANASRRNCPIVPHCPNVP